MASSSLTVSLQNTQRPPVLNSRPTTSTPHGPSPQRSESTKQSSLTGRNNGTNDGEPPDFGGAKPVNLLPEEKKDNTLLASTLTFLLSAGLGFASHFKDNVFGSPTKALKILFTFVAMFSGTVAMATILKPQEDADFQAIDFSHALH